MKYVILFALLLSPVFGKYSQNQVVAAVIIAEAGGEGDIGMRAVASVIMNRARAGRSPLQVVTRKHQFECITRYLSNLDLFVERNMRHRHYQRALVLAKEIENRTLVDVTGGADHYHATSINPYWAPKMKRTKQIGNHIFYKSK